MELETAICFHAKYVLMRMVTMVWKLLSTNPNTEFSEKYKQSSLKLSDSVGLNLKGHLLTISGYGCGGRKGVVLVPEGVYGAGWLVFHNMF